MNILLSITYFLLLFIFTFFSGVLAGEFAVYIFKMKTIEGVSESIFILFIFLPCYILIFNGLGIFLFIKIKHVPVVYISIIILLLLSNVGLLLSMLYQSYKPRPVPLTLYSLSTNPIYDLKIKLGSGKILTCELLNENGSYKFDDAIEKRQDINVSYNINNNKISTSKELTRQILRKARMLKIHAGLFIVFTDDADWHFAYKRENGVYDFLEINGEPEEKREKRLLSAQLLNSVYKGESLEKIRSLINKGANVNYIFPISYMKPLGAAKNIQTLKLLLDSGAKPGIEMVWAARDNKLDYLKLMNKYGGDVNYFKEGTGVYSPLIQAINSNDIDIVKWLIDNEADVNMPIYNGITPIYEAALQDNLAAAKILLEHGADPNQAIETEMTPIEVAREKKYFKMVALLEASNKKK